MMIIVDYILFKKERKSNKNMVVVKKQLINLRMGSGVVDLVWEFGRK